MLPCNFNYHLVNVIFFFSGCNGEFVIQPCFHYSKILCIRCIIRFLVFFSVDSFGIKLLYNPQKLIWFSVFQNSFILLFSGFLVFNMDSGIEWKFSRIFRASSLLMIFRMSLSAFSAGR